MVKTHHITSKKKLKKTDQNSQFILEIWDTLRAKAKLHISSTIKYMLMLWHTKCHSCGLSRVSIQGVKSLWGDCRFIPVDWGSQ